MKVRDILHRKGSDVFSVTEETMVYDAIALMADKNIGALLVLNGSRLSGIISERDYRNNVILKGRQSRSTPVKDIMTHQVFCVTGDFDLYECMTIMSGKKIRHLPVLDEEQNVVGIISIGDVVKAVIDKQKLEIRDLRDYITSGYPA